MNTENLKKNAGLAMSTAIATNFIMTIFLYIKVFNQIRKISLKRLWRIINIMQLILNIPLFSLQVP